MNNKQYLQSFLLYTATRALQDCRHVYLMQSITISEISKQVPDELVPLHGTVQCCVEILTWPSKQHSLGTALLGFDYIAFVSRAGSFADSQAFLLNAYLTVDIFSSTQKRLVGFLLFWHHGKLRNFTFQPRMHGNDKYRTVPQITRFT